MGKRVFITIITLISLIFASCQQSIIPIPVGGTETIIIGTSALEAAQLLDFGKLSNLIFSGGSGFEVTRSITPDEDKADLDDFNIVVSFDDYVGDGYIIESGKLQFNRRVSNTKTGMIDLSYLDLQITEDDPIILIPDNETEKFEITADSLRVTCQLRTIRTGDEFILVDNYTQFSLYEKRGVLSVNGERFTPLSILTEAISDGSGTQEDPYTITTEEGFWNFAEAVNNGSLDTDGVYFRLETDVDLENRDWIPIGNGQVDFNFSYQDSTDSDVPAIFRGHFDGNGHTISNLHIGAELVDWEWEAKMSSYKGLFGFISSGASISNLTINNVNITGTSNIGAFVGFIPQSSKSDISTTVLSDLHVTGDIVIDGKSHVGGIIGRAQYDTDLEIRGCSVEGNSGSYIGNGTMFETTSTNFIGGIVGCAYSRKSDTCITDCSVSDIAIIAAYESAGGIAGHFESGKLENISIRNADIRIAHDTRNPYYPDMTESIGAVAGTVKGGVDSGNEPTSTVVEISGLSVSDVSLSVPVKTEINLEGIVGRFRENNCDNSKLKDCISITDSEGYSEGISINNPE